MTCEAAVNPAIPSRHLRWGISMSSDLRINSCKRAVVLLAELLAAVAIPGLATANPITVFDAKNAGTGYQQGTVGYSLNDGGDITGVVLNSGSVGHGFVRKANGNITVFNAKGAGTGIRQGTAGQDINASGEITGYLIDANGANHGFVRDSGKNGNITVFDVKRAGTGNAQGTIGSAINDSGDVVGTYLDSGTVSHGFIRAATTGKFTTFDVKGAGTSFGQGTTAKDINASGETVGQELDSGSVSHAFIRGSGKKGAVTIFDVKGAGTFGSQGTFANSINASGEIAGQILDSGGVYHAFLRDASGNVTKFNAPGAGTKEGQGTAAYSINDAGIICGAFFDSGTVGHGFVRAANGKITVFDAPGAGTGKDQGTDALAINTSGAIAGYLRDANSIFHGYIRTP
ncbi:MAG: hypothetical protein WBQ17_08140 [Rhizomicrobium sp.]